MNPIASKYGAPLLPQVNLVPKDIAERGAMRRVQTIAALAVLAAVIGLAVVGAGAFGAKTVARGNLDDALAAETAAIEARDAKASVYDQYVVQETREVTMLQVGWAEIDYAALYASITAQVDPEAGYADIHIYGPSAEGTGGVERHPIDGGGVGTFSVIAQTRTYEQANALVKRLEAVPGLAKVQVEIGQYEQEAPAVSWEARITGVLTPLVLTNRLTPRDGLIEVSIVDAIVEAAEDPNAAVTAPVPSDPAASPSPVPSPSNEG